MSVGSLRSSPVRSFKEAEELFGSPPPNSDQLLDLIKMLFSERMTADPLTTSHAGLAMADQYEGQCYSDVIGPAVDTGTWATDEEFEKLKVFFHKAAAFGEARMLTKMMALMNSRAALMMKAQGSA